MSKTMAEVLVDHQRQNSSSCLCGWAKLGHSHPEHQAAALSAAGFGLVAATKQQAAIDAALALAEEWRYKGEHGWGAWQEGYGPDPEGYILDGASADLRTAVGDALGDDG